MYTKNQFYNFGSGSENGTYKVRHGTPCHADGDAVTAQPTSARAIPSSIPLAFKLGLVAERGAIYH